MGFFKFIATKISDFYNTVFEILLTKAFSFYWSFFVTPKLRKEKKLRRNEKPRLFFGPVPIINNKYWSAAMAEAGYYSKTVMMSDAYTIHRKEDFDIYLKDIFPERRSYLGELLRRFRVLKYIVSNYDILHISCIGVMFSRTENKYRRSTHQTETFLLKSSGCKIIVLPFGGDVCQYSKIQDNSFKHMMLSCYPQMALQEDMVEENVKHWVKNADIFIPGFQLDGIGRWDVLAVSSIVIDITTWQSKINYNMADGINGVVYITHSPNHRGIKGTEFIIQAIEDLKKEGLKVELNLIEKKTNTEVKEILFNKTDVLAEQFNLGYGLNGVEGMCTGIPVMADINNEPYTQVLYRYSFLGECPIVSTAIEDVKDNLRTLIKNPQLRKSLGEAGRAYVEKYHSYKKAQFMFGRIYDKIWFGKDVNTINMFHPLMPDSYNNLMPKIPHIPLNKKFETVNTD